MKDKTTVPTTPTLTLTPPNPKEVRHLVRDLARARNTPAWLEAAIQQRLGRIDATTAEFEQLASSIANLPIGVTK